jgi:hypothetical protein
MLVFLVFCLQLLLGWFVNEGYFATEKKEERKRVKRKKRKDLKGRSEK